jgi:hypothetical protein
MGQDELSCYWSIVSSMRPDKAKVRAEGAGT